MNTNMNRPITHQNRGLAIAHLAHARAEVQKAMEYGCADFAEYDRALSLLGGLCDAESNALPIQRTALADELMKIGAMLTSERKFDALASRLMDLSKHIKKAGVFDDDTGEIEF